MMSISIQQQIEYALMTGASYISNRDPKNQFPIPEGWKKVTNQPRFNDDVTGFEVIAFTKGSECD